MKKSIVVIFAITSSLLSGCMHPPGEDGRGSQFVMVIPVETSFHRTSVVSKNFHGAVPGTYVPKVSSRPIYRRCTACGFQYRVGTKHSCRIRVQHRGNLNSGRPNVNFRHHEPQGPRYYPPPRQHHRPQQREGDVHVHVYR